MRKIKEYLEDMGGKEDLVKLEKLNNNNIEITKRNETRKLKKEWK